MGLKGSKSKKSKKKDKKDDDFNLYMSYDVFPTLYQKRKLFNLLNPQPQPPPIPVPHSYIRSYGDLPDTRTRSKSLPVNYHAYRLPPPQIPPPPVPSTVHLPYYNYIHPSSIQSHQPRSTVRFAQRDHVYNYNQPKARSYVPPARVSRNINQTQIPIFETRQPFQPTQPFVHKPSKYGLQKEIVTPLYVEPKNLIRMPTKPQPQTISRSTTQKSIISNISSKSSNLQQSGSLSSLCSSKSTMSNRTSLTSKDTSIIKHSLSKSSFKNEQKFRSIKRNFESSKL